MNPTESHVVSSHFTGYQMTRPGTPSSAEHIVIRAGTSWDATQLADQHLARHLSNYRPVLYVDPPVSRFSRRYDARLEIGDAQPALRPVTDSLSRLTPRVIPGHKKPVLYLVASALARLSLSRARRRLGGRTRAVISVTPRAFSRRSSALRVYWSRDDYIAGAELMGVPRFRLARLERQVLDRADLVVAVSPLLEAKWRSLGARTAFIPNGCDAERFRNVERIENPLLPRPVLGFVGTLSERIDFNLLRSLADRGHSLLIVGAKQKTLDMARVHDLLSRETVRWVGPVAYEELPTWFGQMDVGLVPYTQTRFNAASFPLKTLEYLAAGLPVVTTDLPASRWLSTPFVEIADSPEEFVALTEHAAHFPAPDLAESRRAFAATHDWSKRAQAFADLLGLE